MKVIVSKVKRLVLPAPQTTENVQVNSEERIQEIPAENNSNSSLNRGIPPLPVFGNIDIFDGQRRLVKVNGLQKRSKVKVNGQRSKFSLFCSNFFDGSSCWSAGQHTRY